MTHDRPADHFIESDAEFRAVSSMARYQIITTMRLIEPCSVGDLAARLSRRVETLYYHVDILADAGLIKCVGHRKATRREEALYAVACDRIRFHPTSRDPSFVRRLRRAYSTLFRDMERTLLRAVGHEKECREGPQKNLRVQVFNAALDKKDVAELNRKLNEVRSFLLEKSEARGGEPHQVVLLMTPIVD